MTAKHVRTTRATASSPANLPSSSTPTRLEDELGEWRYAGEKLRERDPLRFHRIFALVAEFVAIEKPTLADDHSFRTRLAAIAGAAAPRVTEDERSGVIFAGARPEIDARAGEILAIARMILDYEAAPDTDRMIERDQLANRLFGDPAFFNHWNGAAILKMIADYIAAAPSIAIARLLAGARAAMLDWANNAARVEQSALDYKEQQAERAQDAARGAA